MSAREPVAKPATAPASTSGPRPAAYLHSVSAQALARVLYVGSGAIVFVLLARRFGPAELGRYALVLSLQNIGVIAADLGTTSLLSRDLVASGAGWRRYVGAFMLFRLVLGVLVGGVAALLAEWWSPGTLRWAFLVCALLLPLNAARFWDPMFQFVGRPYWSAWLGLGYAVLLPAATWLMLAGRGDEAAAASSAFACVGAVYGAAGVLLMFRAVRPVFGRAAFRRLPVIASGAAALGAISLFSMLTLRLDVLLIDGLSGSADLGRYNAAFRLFDLGVAIIVTLQTPLVPLLALLAAEDRARLAPVCRNLMGWTAALGTAGTLFAACLGPALLEPAVWPCVSIRRGGAGIACRQTRRGDAKPAAHIMSYGCGADRPAMGRQCGGAADQYIAQPATHPHAWGDRCRACGAWMRAPAARDHSLVHTGG